MSRETDNIEKLIKEKGVQFRDFKLTKIETRKADDGAELLDIEGVPIVFDTETVLYRGKYFECREKIANGAFDEADTSDVIFNYNHGGTVYARTRNKSLSLSVEKDGLHMKASMRKSARNQEFYDDIKEGLIDKMSFAFTTKECSYETIERQDNEPNVEIRTVTKIDKLYDVSAVDIPAYDTTSISARSAFDSERERHNAESIKRRKLELKLKLEGVN